MIRFKHLAFTWWLSALIFPAKSWAQTPQQLPKESRKQYVSYRDNSLSDEFNGPQLDTLKWGRRNTGGGSIEPHFRDESLVSMESETRSDGTLNQYVSLLGTAKNGPPRTAGLVSKATGFYGFYVVRFRYRGFDSEEVREHGTVWHPAVWSAIGDSRAGVKQFASESRDFWLEIDLMEWENGANGWSSDAPARLKDSQGEKRKVITKGPNAEKGVMHKGPIQIYDPVWQTIGLEYTPEYLKLWNWENGAWQHMGERVVKFVEENPQQPEQSYTLNTIGNQARTPGFWILGNIIARYIWARMEAGTNTHPVQEMHMDFDYFRYYRHKQAVKMDWPWENQQPQGGGNIQKDKSPIPQTP
ncbi:hypothetical protein [Pontibacter sp. G13]|uniref:hypothetical protein n=1 Tax=Pontibacter sp. G13 TaxID=3074898 RepID=UPI00288A6FE7|nr:hypothetical protein [Pontibacter sp. G13]WNJ16567.1 hypothetical protein RJD25_17005 [Pontibacter sp. G13]